MLIFYRIDSTALLIGEKCAMLVAEDLGYSGKALEMKVCRCSSFFVVNYIYTRLTWIDCLGSELSCAG